MRRRLVLCVFLVFTVLSAGCGRGSFVGKRLDNFSAYYNTFYNAEKALEEGIKTTDTGQEQQPINQEVYLPLFGGSDHATSQRKPFEDAILKSADILRKHPDSKWIDDAVLVIGKAWFFTQNYVGAEEKFREVLTLESPLRDEARFWLARTLIASGQYDAAFDHLQESLNRDDISRRWEPKLRLALAELQVQRQNWDDAVAELETGLEGVRDNELAARAHFLTGQVYETLRRYDDAVAAYDRVRAFNPFYELSYAAQYSAVRVQGEHGDPEAALQRLRRMERDDKNYDHRAELAFLRGRVLQAAGRYDDTLDIFHELLYEPTANAGTIRGKIHYALGVFYRDVYEDFPYAAAYFDTAQTNLGRPTVGAGFGAGGRNASQPAYAPAAITDSEEQARIFLEFADVMHRISEKDSLLYLGSLDDSTYQEVVLEMRRKRAEELEAQRREMERLQAERQFQQAGSSDFNTGFGRTPPGKDVSTGKEDANAGFLFHRDAIRIQEARADFILQWGDRPLVPNWRRLDAANNVAPGVGEGDSLLVETEMTPGDDLPEIDLSNVPRDSLSQHQMRTERAVARYELANVLFLSMSRPDSAAAWYRMVIEQDSDEPVAQRAYYALAEVQRALADTLAAERLYRIIVERYPESDFSDKAYERLGLPPEQDVSSDTLALAEAAYDQAYASWKRQDYGPSLNDMVALALDYPETQVAPRALFAAGSVYMEWAVRDSLDLFAVLPLTIPDSVLYTSGVFQSQAPPPGTPPAAPGIGPDQKTPTAQEEDTPGNLFNRPVKQVDTPPVKQVDTPPVKQIDTPAAKQVDTPPVKQIDTPAAKQVDTPPVKQVDTPAAKQVDTPAAKQVDTPAAKQVDTPAEVSEALVVNADSLGPGQETLVDSTTALSDSTAIPEPEPEPEPVRLETLYTSLIARYPQAPQARQANLILEALKERRDARQALADSLAADSLAAIAALTAAETPTLAADSLAVDAPDADTLAADSLAQAVAGEDVASPQGETEDRLRVPDDQQDIPADSSAGEGQKDRLLNMLDERREIAQKSTPPALTDSLDAAADSSEAAPGLDTIDWSQGGWTIFIHTEAEQEQAETFARNFGNYVRGVGHPIGVYTALVQEQIEYRVGIGLFGSQREAGEVFIRIKDRLPSDARIVQIPKL